MAKVKELKVLDAKAAQNICKYGTLIRSEREGAILIAPFELLM